MTIPTLPAEARLYRPVLKGKAGEYRALAALDNIAADRMTPVIEIIDPPAGRSLDDHAAREAKALARAWPVPTSIVDAAPLFAPNGAAIDLYFDALRAAAVSVVPAIGVDADPAYMAAIGAVVARHGRGVCLRVRAADVVSGAFGAAGAPMLAGLGVGPSEVDLLLDVGEILPGQLAQAQLAAAALLSSAAPLDPWRTLTLASAAFPVNLAGMPANSVSTVLRSDWQLWRAVARAATGRIPAFGDYAIAHPVLMTGFDPVTMQMSGSIRYTAADEWLVAKGRSTRTAGWQQMRGVATQLVTRPEYSGASFSWGDQFIADCAAGGPTGNAGSWRKVGTSHHLTFVTDQLANLGAP